MNVENIKYKAKRLDNREWIEGEISHFENTIWIVPIDHKPFHSGCAEVDPDTICMFTGLKDCEGNEIWEGDMLSNVTNDSPDGIVVFKYGAFCLLAKNGRDFWVALTYLLSKKDSLNRFKVVGNKFDNEK